MTTVSISALHVYPVKGCRGLGVARADVRATGLATAGLGDREWMVVDRDGRLVTQREFPQLCRVAVGANGDALTLAVPGRDPLVVAPSPGTGPARDVVVWRDTVRGIDQGDAAARLFSDWLGAPLRLVRFDQTRARLCNPEFAGASGAHTLFADGYPVLVIGRASLDELNARLERGGSPALPMDRFRPNLVVDGLPAHDEDHLDTLTCGDVTLRMVKPCVRCQVTTTDQASGRVGIEPLPTLDGYRHHPTLDGPTFGMNAIVVAGGTLAVGAAVDVKYRF